MRFNRYPSDWRIDGFGDIVQSTSLGTPERGGGHKNITLVKMGCLRWGDVCIDDAEEIDESYASGYPAAVLRDGDFLFNTRNTSELVGKSAVWHLETKAMCDNNILVARMRDPVNPDFICMQMCFGRPRARLHAISCGSTSVAAIYWKDLEQFPVFYPSRAVQDQIVSLINHWSKAIEAIDQKLSRHRMLMNGLMQKLLDGKKRFPGFTKPWRKLTVGDVAEERTVRNQGRLGTVAVRAVNKFEGMIPMKEQVMADDLSRYQVVRQHWFAYNPMRINIGSICQWTQQDEALVSPDYVVFRCRDEVIDHRYFNAFRRSHRWSSFMESAGAGGVRVRIYFSDLALMSIPLPDLTEQRRIADLFEAADREISILERLLVAYQNQKKGLMQQLLTGKRRVKVQAA